MEPFYPLRVYVCDRCFLVQLEEFVGPEDDLHRVRLFFLVFGLLAGARRDATREAIDPAARPRRRRASSSSWPATTATCSSTSSPGASPCLGIEPARQRRRGGRATRASRPGSSSSARSWPASSRREGQRADLLVGNNVLAQVPDLNDFVAGHEGPAQAPAASSPWSSRTSSRLMEGNQFDTIYHEHFSYFSLDRGRDDLRGPRTDRSSTSRSCPPTAGPCGSTRRHAEDGDETGRRAGRRASGAGRAARASAGRRRYARFAEPGPGDQAQAPRVPDRRQAPGQDDLSATARRARATPC
ncbi:MAG: hypothetical protein M0C28_27635 [Candidatus Moduliflexus flocculans]|nr:hypothetical protein [Candidatus Moduliflexus flocculans]